MGVLKLELRLGYGSMEWSLTVWEYGMGEWWHGGMN